MKKRMFALFMILALLICLLPAVALAASGRSSRPGPRPSERPIPTLNLALEEELSAEAEETVLFLPPRSDTEDMETTAEESSMTAEEAYMADTAEMNETLGLIPPQEEPDPYEMDSIPVEAQTSAPVEVNPAPPAETEESLAEAKALAEQIMPDGPVASDEVVVVPWDGDAGSVPADLPDEPKQMVVNEGESVYAYEGTVVFNNGGTIYSNRAFVYNNAGTVYANGGTVYNNAGIVYANDGTIYNNNGTVYNNGAFVHGFVEGSVKESRIFGYYAVHFAEYYDPYITIEGTVIEPDGGNRMVLQDKECRITPVEGFTINSATASNCKIVWNGDGSISLIDLVGEINVALELQATAPVFEIAGGTYATPQTVSFAYSNNGEIIYTDDGSIPTQENGMVYVEPFTVKKSTIITAVTMPRGAKASEPVQISLAFPQFTAPVFDNVEEGYGRVEPKAVRVEADMQSVIRSVSLTGQDAECFILSTGDGRLLERGAVITATWTVQPISGLAAGTYEAEIAFTLDSGEIACVPVQFTVQAAAATMQTAPVEPTASLMASVAA